MSDAVREVNDWMRVQAGAAPRELAEGEDQVRDAGGRFAPPEPPRVDLDQGSRGHGGISRPGGSSAVSDLLRDASHGIRGGEHTIF